MPLPADTIAAIATASGSGGVAIVRVSGGDLQTLAVGLLGALPPPRRAVLRRFRDRSGEPIDHGLALYFPAPQSYTGEAVLELHGHGGRILPQRLLQRCLELGARLARPGEFSERAFLNGRLDLAQAEAVADLVAAGSEAAARAALRSLEGVFSRRVEALAEGLLRLRVHVEAAIDFPEEEIDFLADRAIASQLTQLIDQHAELLAEARHGQRLRDGLHVVILGPPNAGKSSLLNALAGSERAIVTAAAGTTRDVLREPVRVDDVELLLVDTAGLRSDSRDPIEREGIRRALLERERADLVLALVEDTDLAAETALSRELDGVAEVVWLHNKIDRSGGAAGPRDGAGRHLGLSLKTGAGVAELRALLRDFAGGQGCAAGSFSARARHVEALRRAGQALERAQPWQQQRQGELLAEELRLAHHALGEITGTVDADALLGEIFTSFCIGK